MIIQLNIMGLKHALEARDFRLYSNQEIAGNAGLSRDTVSKIVRNKTTILHLRTLRKLIFYFQKKGLVIEQGSFFCWQENELVSNIGPLMRRLDSIPTEKQIAQETHIPLLRVNNLVKGNIKRVYLSDLAALFVFFRQRGVEIELGDLLKEEKGVPELA